MANRSAPRREPRKPRSRPRDGWCDYSSGNIADAPVEKTQSPSRRCPECGRYLRLQIREGCCGYYYVIPRHKRSPIK